MELIRHDFMILTRLLVKLEINCIRFDVFIDSKIENNFHCVSLY